MFQIKNNKDAGSLHIGQVESLRAFKEGDKIRVAGENSDRTCTYIMGKGEKLHACFKGTGPFSMGDVEFEVVE